MLTFALFFATSSMATPKNVLLIDGPPHNSVGWKIHNQLVDAYAKIGIELRLSNVPLQRSFIEANKGNLDVLRARVYGVEKTYKNLRKVPFALTESDILLVTHVSLRGSSTDWHNCHQARSCVASSFGVIGLTKGYGAWQAYLNRHRLASSLIANMTEYSKSSQVANLLLNRRLDSAILPAGVVVGSRLEESLQWRQTKIDSYHLYHYVHKQHESLIAPLFTALKAPN